MIIMAEMMMRKCTSRVAALGKISSTSKYEKHLAGSGSGRVQGGKMIQVAFTLLPSQRQTFQRHPDSAKETGDVEGGGSIGGRQGLVSNWAGCPGA